MPSWSGLISYLQANLKGKEAVLETLYSEKYLAIYLFRQCLAMSESLLLRQ